MLHIRVATVLGDHLERSAIYTSPDVQNQIIEILGHNGRHKILLSKVHKVQFLPMTSPVVVILLNLYNSTISVEILDVQDVQGHLLVNLEVCIIILSHLESNLHLKLLR